MFRIILIGFIALQAAFGAASDNAFFAARRERLMKRIGGSVAVLQGAYDTRAYDPFRQDNNFYYLTGVEIPNALLMLDGAQHRSILFLPPRNEKSEKWEGKRLVPGPEARRVTGIEEVLELSCFEDELEKRKNAITVLYIPRSPYEIAATSQDRAIQHEETRQSNPRDGRISREAAFEKSLQARLDPSASIEDLAPILDDLRRVKDTLEIERLREAGRIGALGFREAIRSTSPGMYEYQLSALAEFVFLWNGSAGFAFFPIVGSGPNSCIVHYSENRRKMAAGDIVVMDFGPDYEYYGADITRTFPVSGKFTREQAKVYQAVLDTQKAVLEKVRPGATFDELESAAHDALEHFGYDKYSMHAVSHYVGMAIHDVGSSKPFQEGVVIAVEPGVYMNDENLGVRIEDTVLVTKDGYEILTKYAPKEISEIEALMSERGIAEEIKN